MKRIALALLPLALLGAKSRDPFAGLAAGTPTDCIQVDPQRSLVITDRNMIQYRESRRVWRVEPMGRCPSLKPLNTLIVEINGGQLCRGDRFRVLEPGLSIPSGACLFGKFTPYEKPKP